MPSQLAATRGDCADCGIAGANASQMRASRFTDGAWLCMKCWLKEAPADRVCASCEKGVDTVKIWLPSKLIEGAPWLCGPCFKREAPADRVCASCEKGVDTVKSWQPSKRIEGAPWLCNACYKREVRTSLSCQLLSRERERATSSATVRFSAHRAPFALPVLRSKRKR